jgi:hypothetical protein
MSAALPELVWNKGIAALCDWRIPDEFPSGSGYVPNRAQAGASLLAGTPDTLIASPERYRGIRDGDLVWVRLSWLKSFIAQVLPRTRARFVLATGDADDSVPWHIGPIAGALLAHPNVICWFAQNCNAPSPDGRLRPLPIGIDFHTLSERARWGQTVATPAQQERELNLIARALRPLEERVPDVYVDFAWTRALHGGRRDIVRRLSANLRVFLQGGKLSRAGMWQERGRYAFVVSPRGNGLDCHRTWEALALGHIVLVPRSPLDPLFDGLAVVSLEDWSEITSANLSRWLASHGPLARSSLDQRSDALTSQSWIEIMRAAAHLGHDR